MSLPSLLKTHSTARHFISQSVQESISLTVLDMGNVLKLRLLQIAEVGLVL